MGVYFAEVVGVRAQGGTTSGNTVGAGAFMDLANVQVLKGPQGTLFGRNTTGGAILLTPKKPTDRFEGYVEGSAGNYSMYKIDGAVNIPISDNFKVRFAAEKNQRDGYMINRSGIAGSAPFFNDRNYESYRASVVINVTPDIENYTIFQYSNSHTYGYGAKITSCANASNGLITTGFGTPGYSGTRDFTAKACGGQLDRQTARGDGLYDVESAVLNPYLKIKQWQVINTTTWRASDNLTIKNIASYGEFREATHFDLYTSNFQIAQPGFFLGNISPQLPFTVAGGTPFKYIELDITAPGGNNSAEKTFTEELQFQGNFGDKFNYVVGGYLEFARPIGLSSGRTGIYMNCTSPQDLACTNPLFFGSISESRTALSFNNHGIFAQGTYNFDDRFSLTAGIRYTFDNIFGYTVSTRASLLLNPLDPRYATSAVDARTGVHLTRQCTDSFRLGNAVIAGGDFSLCRTDLKNPSTAPTWTINPQFKISPDAMVYAKWSRGYRQGGLNFTNPGLESWKPEHLDTFEIGAKASFHGAVSGYLNMAAYYNKLRDFQLFAGLVASPAGAASGVSGGAAIINAGKAHSYGIEIDGSLSMADGALRFDLGYAYLNTKIDTLPSAADLAATLVGTPFGQITPTASVGSQFTLAPNHKLTLGGTYTLPLPESVGKLSVGLTMAYTSSQIANGSVPAILGPVGGGMLPSRTLLNLNINWNKVAGTPIDASFFVTNLTNKAYAVNTGGGWNSSGIGDMLLGEPRMWGFRIKYSFGN